MTGRMRPLPLLGLTLVWVMLLGEITIANIVLGLLAAGVVLWVFPMPPMVSTLRPHPVGMVRLVLRFLSDLVGSSLSVAAMALRPRPIGPGALIEVRLRLDDDLRRTMVAELTSLVPGTVVIDLDQATSILTLHVLDITDQDQLLRECRKVHRLEDRVEAALSTRPAATTPSADTEPTQPDEREVAR